MQNHLDSPLVLSWENGEYKVNKPNIEGGEFIDKEIVFSMMAALHNALLDNLS